MDRLRSFLGSRPIVVNGIPFYSPTIDQIDEISEVMYHVYLNLAVFDKESIFKNLFKATDDEYSQLEELDDYDALTISLSTAVNIAQGLSFFTKSDFTYDPAEKEFANSSGSKINKDNYTLIVDAIRNLNGLEKKKVQHERQFRTKKAQAKYQELMQIRKQYQKNDGLELKDMLSILCNANGNGINIFNIGQLTIYQVYEHFERLNVKESHQRVLQVWANGLLKENSKLPEWIIKTKL